MKERLEVLGLLCFLQDFLLATCMPYINANENNG